VLGNGAKEMSSVNKPKTEGNGGFSEPINTGIPTVKHIGQLIPDKLEKYDKELVEILNSIQEYRDSESMIREQNPYETKSREEVYYPHYIEKFNQRFGTKLNETPNKQTYKAIIAACKWVAGEGNTQIQPQSLLPAGMAHEVVRGCFQID
jgi:hypothetical protein